MRVRCGAWSQGLTIPSLEVEPPPVFVVRFAWFEVEHNGRAPAEGGGRGSLGCMQIDDVVLWVDDPKRALAFYVDVIGLEAERAEEFEEATAPFPSVRLNETTILDLMARAILPSVQGATQSGSTRGAPIDHVCLSMSRPEYIALTKRLTERGIELAPGGAASFGAQGVTAHSAYFSEPDGNVLEIRHYGLIDE